MKIHVPLAVVSVLLGSACADSSRNAADAGARAPEASRSVMHTYRCESGQTVAAAYPTTDSATVEYKRSRYNMRIAVSASGARYVADSLEWWTKGSGPGSEGTVLRHLADGTSGQIVESCKES